MQGQAVPIWDPQDVRQYPSPDEGVGCGPGCGWGGGGESWEILPSVPTYIPAVFSPLAVRPSNGTRGLNLGIHSVFPTVNV